MQNEVENFNKNAAKKAASFRLTVFFSELQRSQIGVFAEEIRKISGIAKLQLLRNFRNGKVGFFQKRLCNGDATVDDVFVGGQSVFCFKYADEILLGKMEFFRQLHQGDVSVGGRVNVAAHFFREGRLRSVPPGFFF